MGAAPKDGRVIWAAGNVQGDPRKGLFFEKAFWGGGTWISAFDRRSQVTYIHHWSDYPLGRGSGVTVKDK